MDIEQLKLVLSTLQSVGVEGKQAFIWWLAADKLLPFVTDLLFMAAVVFVILRVGQSFLFSNRDTNRTLEIYRKVTGTSTYDYLSTNEYAELLEDIDRLKANQK